MQALTHLTGAVRSVELAAIGRRVCEVEWDLLELLPWPASADDLPPSTPAAQRANPARTTPRRRRSCSRRSASSCPPTCLGATTGRVRFHVRVAANVIAMVDGEIELGPEMALAHAERLAAARRVERGRVGRGHPRPGGSTAAGRGRDAVRATVADKLAVANPAYRD